MQPNGRQQIQNISPYSNLWARPQVPVPLAPVPRYWPSISAQASLLTLQTVVAGSVCCRIFGPSRRLASSVTASYCLVSPRHWVTVLLLLLLLLLLTWA
ncbi:hypothetical protein ACLKA6_001860 [Drosophila palustris]